MRESWTINLRNWSPKHTHTHTQFRFSGYVHISCSIMYFNMFIHCNYIEREAFSLHSGALLFMYVGWVDCFLIDYAESVVTAVHKTHVYLMPILLSTFIVCCCCQKAVLLAHHFASPLAPPSLLLLHSPQLLPINLILSFISTRNCWTSLNHRHQSQSNISPLPILDWVHFES